MPDASKEASLASVWELDDEDPDDWDEMGLDAGDDEDEAFMYKAFRVKSGIVTAA
jgi:hypothetical protein